MGIDTGNRGWLIIDLEMPQNKPIIIGIDMKKILLLSTILLIAAAGMNTAQAQFRRVMIEEFTGAWCGWCPGGELQIQELQAKYPGQVVAVSIHSNQGSDLNDMMDVPQGDTLMAGIPALSGETAVTSFPDGWLSRTAISGTWNTTAQSTTPWIDTLNGTGLVEQMLGQKAEATVSVDSISYDASNGTITARVNATFNQAMSGDLRFSLYVTEDSVTGTGAGYDQHNYYYHSTEFVGPYYNLGNPYYISQNGVTELDGSTIPGWEHMQVFRYSPGPVWGTTGVIPASVTSGATYSQIYTFQVPSNVQNINQVKLVGLLTNYSATTLATNTIIDADEEPLIGVAPKYLLTSVTVGVQSQYGTAKSNGTTPETMLFTNNGPVPVTLQLGVKSSSLPTGWSGTLTPDTITVNAGATGTSVLNVTAPEQSAYVGVEVTATPIAEGYLTSTTSASEYMLSDNTQYPVLYDPSEYLGDETITSTSLPDSMKLHSAVIPMTAATIAAYPPENYPVSIYNNFLFLDNGGYYSNAGPLLDIENSLAAGEKVFLSSDAAMSFAFDPNATNFPSELQTDAVQSFYQYLGLDFTATEDRFNTSTGAAISYSIKGETGDSIGNGISVTNAGGLIDGQYAYNAIYTIDSNSIPVFYSGSSASKDVIGSRFQDPVTGGRIVYLGFDLDGITSATEAGTIYSRSIDWLLSTEASAAVNLPAVVASGITASPNPFHGVTQINYTASQDEQNVTLAAYDVLGRQVAVLPTRSSGDNGYVASFDGSKLAQGTYVIMAHSSKGTSQVQVVNQ
jgi:thiol-disulfide isomerase/thioredoxin